MRRSSNRNKTGTQWNRGNIPCSRSEADPTGDLLNHPPSSLRFFFHEDRAGEYLVKITKESIKHFLKTGTQLEKPTDYPIELDEELGVFVTLNKKQ